jgi:hypothetical protein
MRGFRNVALGLVGVLAVLSAVVWAGQYVQVGRRNDYSKSENGALQQLALMKKATVKFDASLPRYPPPTTTSGWRHT